MNNYYDSSVKKKEKQEIYKKNEAEIIPWPDMEKALKQSRKEKPKQKLIRLDQKHIYYKGKKYPILQFQKSGYDKLLKLLVKEMGR